MARVEPFARHWLRVTQQRRRQRIDAAAMAQTPAWAGLHPVSLPAWQPPPSLQSVAMGQPRPLQPAGSTLAPPRALPSPSAPRREESSPPQRHAAAVHGAQRWGHTVSMAASYGPPAASSPLPGPMPEPSTAARGAAWQPGPRDAKSQHSAPVHTGVQMPVAQQEISAQIAVSGGATNAPSPAVAGRKQRPAPRRPDFLSV